MRLLCRAVNKFRKVSQFPEMLALSQLRIYYDNAHLITGSRHEFGTLKQKSQLLVEMVGIYSESKL